MQKIKTNVYSGPVFYAVETGLSLDQRPSETKVEILSVYNAYDTLANRLENNTHGHNNGTVKVRSPRLQQWYINNIKTEIVEAR